MNGIEHLRYMESASELGSGSITLTFDAGTNLDLSAVETQNRIKRVEARLPEDVRRLGITVTKSARNYVMFVALFSPTRVSTMSRWAVMPAPACWTVSGACRVWARRCCSAPNTRCVCGSRRKSCQSYNLSPADVSRAVRAQNSQLATGELGQLPSAPGQQLSAVIITKSRLSSPEEFGNIIVRTNPDGSTLRVKDVARVELGAQDYSRAHASTDSRQRQSRFA